MEKIAKNAYNNYIKAIKEHNTTAIMLYYDKFIDICEKLAKKNNLSIYEQMQII